MLYTEGSIGCCFLSFPSIILRRLNPPPISSVALFASSLSEATGFEQNETSFIQNRHFKMTAIKCDMWHSYIICPLLSYSCISPSLSDELNGRHDNLYLLLIHIMSKKCRWTARFEEHLTRCLTCPWFVYSSCVEGYTCASSLGAPPTSLFSPCFCVLQMHSLGIETSFKMTQ